MLSSRAAAFSVNALLNDGTTTDPPSREPSFEMQATPGFSKPDGEGTPKSPQGAWKELQEPSVISKRYTIEPEVNASCHSAIDSLCQMSGKCNEPHRDVFTQGDDGWLSIKGKECKIFPYKIARTSPDNRNSHSKVKREPGTNSDSSARRFPNSATFLDMSQARTKNKTCVYQDSRLFDILRHESKARAEANYSACPVGFENMSRLNTGVERGERSSSAGEAFNAPKNQMEHSHGTRNSFSHPSVLSAETFRQLETTSVSEPAILDQNVFESLKKRTTEAPRTLRVMDFAATFGVQTGGKTISEPHQCGSDYRNQFSDIGKLNLEGGIRNQFPTIGAFGFRNGLRNQYPYLGQATSRSDARNQTTQPGETAHLGSFSLNVTPKSLSFNNRDNDIVLGNESYDNISQHSSEGVNINETFDSTNRRALFSASAQLTSDSKSRMSDLHFNEMRPEMGEIKRAPAPGGGYNVATDIEAHPVIFAALKSGLSNQNENIRSTENQKEPNRDESHFRNWLTFDTLGNPPLCPRTHLIQSALQVHPGQELRSSATNFRHSKREEFQRLVNERTPPTEAYRPADLEETEIVRLKGGVTVELLQKDLWQKFHRHGTEMIITKIGRRMFPVLRVRFSGLDPSRMYLVYVDMHPVDNKRYRYVYQSSCWLVAGAGENHTEVNDQLPSETFAASSDHNAYPTNTPRGAVPLATVFPVTGTTNSIQGSGNISGASGRVRGQNFSPGSSFYLNTTSGGDPSSNIPSGSGPDYTFDARGGPSRGVASAGSAGVYLHPDSPAPGAHWNGAHSIAFDKLKLTNNRRGRVGGQICLHSMQKYQPRIWLQEVYSNQEPKFDSDGYQGSTSTGSFSVKEDLQPLPGDVVAFSPTLAEVDRMDVDEPVVRAKQHNRRKPVEQNTTSAADWLAKIDMRAANAAVFPVTSFITVTAYQNQQVTRLKISANPFAKGFRETVRQRDDSDADRRHHGALHDPSVHPFYHHNLPNPLHPYFPHQPTLPPLQAMHPLAGYPQFLIPSLPFLNSQWNMVNSANKETIFPPLFPNGLPVNLDDSIHSNNVHVNIRRPERFSLPWDHNVTSNDANKLSSSSPSLLERISCASNEEENHSLNTLKSTLMRTTSSTLPFSRSGVSTMLPLTRHNPIRNESTLHRYKGPAGKHANSMPLIERVNKTPNEPEIDVSTVPTVSWENVNIKAIPTACREIQVATSTSPVSESETCDKISLRPSSREHESILNLSKVSDEPVRSPKRMDDSSLQYPLVKCSGIADSGQYYNRTSIHGNQESLISENILKPFLFHQPISGDTTNEFDKSLNLSAVYNDCAVLDLTSKNSKLSS